MTKNDREAMALAIETMRREGPEYAEHLKDGFAEAGKFAAYCCQMRSLRLPPWESPPCHAYGFDNAGPAAKALLAKMEAAGISIYHPDPLKALKAAKAQL